MNRRGDNGMKEEFPNPIPINVIHNSQLFFNIQVLEDLYTAPKISQEDLLVLSKDLAAAHVPAPINVLDKYGIDQHELITGVICPSCLAVPMVRKKYKWYCATCLWISEDAHISAFNDYKLLINDHISNKQAREFLQIDSPYIAKYLLQKEKYKYTGKTSSRKYELVYKKVDFPNKSIIS